MSSAGVSLAIHPVREASMLCPIRFDGSRSPHCLPESIVIYLAAPGSPVIPMQISESDSIASVKLRIQICRGFVVKKQKLIFDGRELARNGSLVRDYGVADGNVLHLIISFSDIICITVITACGKKYELQVEKCRNIRFIKQQLAKKGKDLGSLEDHKLICDGQELDDLQLIDNICKSNDTAIHLLIRKSDFELSIVAPDPRERKAADEFQIIAQKPQFGDPWVQPVVANPIVKLSPAVMAMVQSTSAGLQKGNMPIMSAEGSGGAYFMQDASSHKYVAVFKPIDEEPMAENNPRGLPLSIDGEGLKRGTRVGEGALREVAAYILDHPLGTHRVSDEVGFAGVPPTVMVRCLNGDSSHLSKHEFGVKNVKVGSLQMYVKNIGSCEDMGPRAFPVEEVHKIAVLDIRLANADRHAGNILVCKEGEEERVTLVPIDHGYCLPENFEDCTFEWLYWPQARKPFNDETIGYIKALDDEEDIALLKFYGWELSPQCARILRISTMLLKKGVERCLTPYDIGSIMCRETLKKESKIERIVQEAKYGVLPGCSEDTFLELVSEIMDRYLDQELHLE